MITIKVSESDAKFIQHALKAAAALETAESGDGGKLQVPIGTRVSAVLGRVGGKGATEQLLTRLEHSVETLVLANQRR